jgi:hypothetical protein
MGMLTSSNDKVVFVLDYSPVYPFDGASEDAMGTEEANGNSECRSEHRDSSAITSRERERVKSRKDETQKFLVTRVTSQGMLKQRGKVLFKHYPSK